MLISPLRSESRSTGIRLCVIIIKTAQDLRMEFIPGSGVELWKPVPQIVVSLFELWLTEPHSQQMCCLWAKITMNNSASPGWTAKQYKAVDLRAIVLDFPVIQPKLWYLNESLQSLWVPSQTSSPTWAETSMMPAEVTFNKNPPPPPP